MPANASFCSCASTTMKSENAETLDSPHCDESAPLAPYHPPSKAEPIAGAIASQAPDSREGKSLAMERGLLLQLLRKLGDPPFRIVLWDGTEILSGDRPPIATLIVRSRSAFFRMLWDPNLHFGDDYASGDIEVEGDFVGFLATLYTATVDVPFSAAGLRLFPGERRPRRNTLKALARAHPSSLRHRQRLLPAVARRPRCSTRARISRLRRAPSRRRSWPSSITSAASCGCEPGDTVVEAGCGWGGLALHMARHYGVAKVRAFNISEEQVRFARERAERGGAREPRRVCPRRLPQYRRPLRRVRLGRDARARRRRQLSGAGRASSTASLTPEGRGLIHTHRPQPPRLHAPVDRAAHLPGRASSGVVGDDADLRDRAGCRCSTSRTCARTTRMTLHHWLERFEASRERGAGDVRRTLRAHVATLSRRLEGGVHRRRAAALPGPVRAADGQRLAAHARTGCTAMSDAALRVSCDVLVVGGGPAGSTCALGAHAGGRRRGRDGQAHAFPRDKVCAGWITPAVVESLQLDVEDVPPRARVPADHRLSHRAARRARGRDRLRRAGQLRHPALRVRRLSAAALRRAARTGRDRCARSSATATRWLVNGRIRARMLVGAGGHFCPVARHLGAELGSSRVDHRGAGGGVRDDAGAGPAAAPRSASVRSSTSART